MDDMKHTLKNADSRGKVVDTPRSADSRGDDGGRGDEIVGEAVVQVSLHVVSQIALDTVVATHPTPSVQMWGQLGCHKRTWSSKTSLTLSNSFSYLFQRHIC